jgi:hypothetical protein
LARAPLTLLKGGVDHDAVQPSSQARVLPKPLKGPKGVEERGLHDVVCVLGVFAEDPLGGSVKASGVGASDLLQAAAS